MPFKRRTNFLINKPLQLKLLWQTLLHVFLFVGVTGVSLFLPAMIELRNIESHSEKAVMAANQVLYLHGYFWPASLLALSSIFLLSIRSSHKIVGPLFCFKRTFEAIKEGKLPLPIRIRKGDYLLEEAEQINEMLQALRENVWGIQEAGSVLKETISECAQAAEQSSAMESDERFQGLLEKAHQLEDRLKIFRIVS